MWGHTDECDVDATRREGPTFCGPSESVLEDPGIEVVFGVLGEAQIWGRDALQDVVVVLGGPEDAGRWVGNVPGWGEMRINYYTNVGFGDGEVNEWENPVFAGWWKRR